MPTFEPGDLVRVPFPYTDRPVRQRRPALVVAAGELADHQGLLWVVMVTSASHRRWPGDVEIADHAASGLPAPSIVRPAKIATIEVRDAAPLGRVPDDIREAALESVAKRLGR
jgi:mRNA interferase MazF